jgi:hypothetical protein
MEKILRKNNVKTYCEHCEREFENVWICKMESIIGTRYALLCTGCQRLKGIYSSLDFIERMNISNAFINGSQIHSN